MEIREEKFTDNNMWQYESYKDSGVEWLGEIPEHWEHISNEKLSTDTQDILELEKQSDGLIAEILNLD